MSDIPFSVQDALAAQRELRKKLGLGEERFPMSAFMGMLSDEIEQMRAAGRTDAEVAAAIAHATGKTLTPEDVAGHYVPANRRRQR